MPVWIELFVRAHWLEMVILGVVAALYVLTILRLFRFESCAGSNAQAHTNTLPDYHPVKMVAALLLLPALFAMSGCGLHYNHITPKNSGSSNGDDPGTGNGGGSGTGNGGSATSELSLNPQTLSWGKVGVGQISGAKTITVTNPNTAGIEISSISVGNGFIVSGNTCPLSSSTLAAGASCTLSVQFRPLAEGPLTQDLTLASSASQEAQSVALSGTGAAGPLLFAPSSLSFPSAAAGSTSPQQVVTLTNTTSSDITMTAITHTNVFPEANDCTPTLAGGASCSFTLSFAPICSGDYAGTVTAHAGNSTVQLYLSGTATGTANCPGPATPSGNTGLSISPGRLLFGDQAPGTTTTLPLLVTNYQSYAIDIASISIAAPFSQVNNCPATLPQGFSCKINVSYVPVFKGYSSEMLSITDSGTAAPQVIPVAGNAIDPAKASSADARWDHQY